MEVYVAADGERAIDFIRKAENNPDGLNPHILLLDINLPRIDGFEVLRRVRASDKFKHIPVLMITSSDSPADRLEATSLGARYFRKPVVYDQFLKLGPFLRDFLVEQGLL